MPFWSAVVLAVGLVLAALAHGGIFLTAINAGGEESRAGVYRINKFTGSIVYCQGNVCLVPESID